MKCEIQVAITLNVAGPCSQTLLLQQALEGDRETPVVPLGGQAGGEAFYDFTQRVELRSTCARQSAGGRELRSAKRRKPRETRLSG